MSGKENVRWVTKTNTHINQTVQTKKQVRVSASYLSEYQTWRTVWQHLLNRTPCLLTQVTQEEYSRRSITQW